MNMSRAELETLLHDFGHERFRPGQRRVIQNLLQGRDVLAVMPTGAGKSLLFQLAAQALPGLTIVVSPLIALMKDQVESLEAVDLRVASINSSQTAAVSRDELEAVQTGEAKLLYITPERFDSTGFIDALDGVEVSLVAIDEAHCLSEWGHDFRPSYLGLGSAIRQLSRPVVAALTATATPWVRREIIERLGMRDPDIVVHGIDRPNLFFEVVRIDDETDDYRVLRQLLASEDRAYTPGLRERFDETMQGSGIIYTTTTKAARETAGWLNDWGISADYYHGKRNKADRARVQEAFMSGAVRVICATNAFGLGVDKPDVRFVIHRDVPGSVEAYFQEAGRAGRDGGLARCTLIYRPGDLARVAFLNGAGTLDVQDIEAVRAHLLRYQRTTARKMSEATGLRNGHLARISWLLSDEGIIHESAGRIRMLVDDFNPHDLALDREEHRRQYERSRVEMMRGYAELGDACRREYILNYFGEEYERDRCGLCDNDLLAGDTAAGEVDPDADRPFAIGDAVVHDAWGAGEVQRVTDDTVTILFRDAGYRTVSTALVQQEGLLRPVGQSD